MFHNVILSLRLNSCYIKRQNFNTQTHIDPINKANYDTKHLQGGTFPLLNDNG